jgi:murein DD-endopeptidase MepM/ murein hydrolase activator NlpD
MTIYGHMTMNSVTIKPVGAAVACGEQIGAVGTSGNSSGMHLHFEVRPGGLNSPAVDPFAGPCSTPVSRWVDQADGHPAITCENGVTGPPTAPHALTATAVSTSQVNLNWSDNAINETGYSVERATLPGGPWAQIATANSNATNHADSGLTASSTYFYRVRATNDSGTSAYSNVAQSNTSNAPPVLATITNRTVAGGSLVTFTASATDAALGLTTVITDFEDFVPSTAYVMFRSPSYSGYPSGFLTSPDISAISAAFPAGNPSTRALNVNWGFNSSAGAWMRLTTASAPHLPNPTVSFRQILRFDIYSDKSLRLGLGLSETATTADIGENGGTSGSIEFVGVTNTTPALLPSPTRTIPPLAWTNLSFNIPAEPVKAFTGNGVLTSATGKGTIEHLAFVPDAGAGAYNVYLDNFTQTLPNALTYSLDAGAPAGATINSNSGVFAWTAPSVSSPTTNTITVRVTDNGSPALNDTETFQIVVVPPTPVPSAPVASAATSVTSSGFTANWGSLSNATGYRLDVSTNNGFGNFVSGYQDLDVGNATNPPVTGLSASTTYYYRARAYNLSGTSTNSGTITVTSATAVSPPSAPTANAATSVTNSGFTANWTSASGATGYRLDVSTNNGFSSYVSGYQDLDVGNVTSRSVSSLSAGKTYYYRLRAYNGGGPSENSATITVTLPATTGCAPNALVNADFEGSYDANGVATGWTAYEVNSPGTKVWSIQTASAPQGLQYQQIQAYNAAHTASAGVRQDVTGCTAGATYRIAGRYRSNSDNGRARVRVSPTASTDWSTAMDLNPVADYGSGTNWTTFSGTVVATGPSMTIWLDGRTIGGTSAKVGCFDGVTVTCEGAAVPLQFDSIIWLAQKWARLTLSGDPGDTVTIHRSSNLLDWILLTNLANPTGTLEFTDTSTTNTLRRYYRAASP